MTHFSITAMKLSLDILVLVLNVLGGIFLANGSLRFLDASIMKNATMLDAGMCSMSTSCNQQSLEEKHNIASNLALPMQTHLRDAVIGAGLLCVRRIKV